MYAVFEVAVNQNPAEVRRTEKGERVTGAVGDQVAVE